MTDALLPDGGGEAAHQALRAAEDVRAFDGPATAWLVVQRALEVVGMAMVLSGIAVGSVLVGPRVWIVVGLALLVVTWEGPMARWAGAEPRRWPLGRRVLAGTALLAAVVVVGIATSGSPIPTGDAPFVVGAAGAAACYLAAPVVRWAWSLRSPRRPVTWPEGAQAFAVLAVLSRVQWMHPDRLAELTHLPRQSCDEWVQACAARGLVVPAARRWGHLRHAEVTAGGRSRLAAWTAELTERAAGAAPAAAPAASGTTPG